MKDQCGFDLVIGRLDRVLSCMIEWAGDPELDGPNRQTLKHHAKDMIGAGDEILKKLTPRPAGTDQAEPPRAVTPPAGPFHKGDVTFYIYRPNDHTFASIGSQPSRPCWDKGITSSSYSFASWLAAEEFRRRLKDGTGSAVVELYQNSPG